MFNDKDIICFLGDSITAAGLWMAEVYQHLRKKRKIKCYNCGVSGSNAEKIVGYLYSECLSYNPDYVVLMLGMNEFGRGYYDEAYDNSPKMLELREKMFQVHRQCYESIVKSCIEFGAEVIICLPTPYDEVTESEVWKVSYQRALDMGAGFQQEIAAKYGCKVVNFKDAMLPMLGKKAVIKDDRVHPNEYGHHVMAQLFLKELGEIDTCDFDTPFVFEEWNRKRFEAESENEKLNYVELCETLFDGYAKNKSVDEIKEIARQKAAKDDRKIAFIDQAYQEYIEKGELRRENKVEILKRTIF